MQNKSHKKHTFSKLSIATSQLTIAAMLATSASGCGEQAPPKPQVQAQDDQKDGTGAGTESFPLPEPTAAGEEISEVQFFEKLQATVPASARTQVERAFEVIQRRNEGLEGTQIAQVTPMHFLTDAKVRQVQVKLTRNGESAGYLNLALSKHNDHVWFDSDSSSKTTPLELLLRRFPEARRAVKLYQVGLVDVAAEDEHGNLLGYVGINAPSPKKFVEFWNQRKSNAPAVMPDQDEVYNEDDAVYPEDPQGYVKDCEDNRMKKKVLRDDGLPIWNQFTVDRKGQECWVGCTPLAFGMAMAWMDVAWPSVNFIMGPGKESKVDNNNKFGPAPTLIKEVAEGLGTYCGESEEGEIPLGYTSLSPKDLERRLDDLLKYKNRGKTDVWSDVIDYRDRPNRDIEEDIFNELRNRNRPVVISSGSLSKLEDWDGSSKNDGHSWAIDGVCYPTIKGCEPKRRKVRMNWGWGGGTVSDVYDTLADTSWFRLHKFSRAVNTVTYFKKSRNGCSLPVGHKDYCKECGPCRYGDGHCRNDNECEGELVCEANQGKRFGLKSSRSVCVSPEVSDCEVACHRNFDDCISASASIPGEKPDISGCREARQRCLSRC